MKMTLCGHRRVHALCAPGFLLPTRNIKYHICPPPPDPHASVWPQQLAHTRSRPACNAHAGSSQGAGRHV